MQEAIRARDADVTASEVYEALEAEVKSLDANSFTHLWRDGISKPISEREPDVLRRRRVLTGLARCARKSIPLTSLNVAEQKGAATLSETEITATLHDFARRGVLDEADGEFKFRLPIFERWLKQEGLMIVQPDPVSEELAASVQAEEDAAHIRSDEIVKLYKNWPNYKGNHVGTDEIRAWYEQVEGLRNQRILFKILTQLKFVGESEIRERCKSMYLQINKRLREFVRYSLTDRRTDVLLTYLDGHGKVENIIHLYLQKKIESP